MTRNSSSCRCISFKVVTSIEKWQAPSQLPPIATQRQAHVQGENPPSKCRWKTADLFELLCGTCQETGTNKWLKSWSSSEEKGRKQQRAQRTSYAHTSGCTLLEGCWSAELHKQRTDLRAP